MKNPGFQPTTDTPGAERWPASSAAEGAWRSGGVVRLVPEVAAVPDDAAGLRAANARLRELPAERDAEVAVLREQLSGLQSQVADLAARVASNSRNFSKPPSSKPSPAPSRAGPGSPNRIGQSGTKANAARARAGPAIASAGAGTERAGKRHHPKG